MKIQRSPAEASTPSLPAAPVSLATLPQGGRSRVWTTGGRPASRIAPLRPACYARRMPESTDPGWIPMTRWPVEAIRRWGAIECRCADGSTFVASSLFEVRGVGGPAVAYRRLTSRTFGEAIERQDTRAQTAVRTADALGCIRQRVKGKAR